MRNDVHDEIAKLGGMAVGELQRKYAAVFEEPTRSFNKPYLIKRIAWGLQAQAEGGVSERAKARAAELARDIDLRMTAPRAAPVVVANRFAQKADARLPMPGTILKRTYKGQTLEVVVRDRGFEFEGQVYRSLTAIAKKVTGAHWNGYLFFGMPKSEAAS